MIKAAIIVADQLQRAGLLSLLAENFEEIEVTIIDPVELSQNLDYDLYFTDSVNYVSEQGFFALRRKYCAVIVSFMPDNLLIPATSASLSKIEPLVINSFGSIEQITVGIRALINTLPSENSSFASTASNELSTREIQVLTAVVSGSINKEIAAELGISLNTVLTHRKNITAKLGIKTVSGLTLYALMRGYI